MDAILTRLMDAQNVWARPLGEFVQRIVKALFRPVRPLKDFLNGTWLGHSVHVALTDFPIGAFTVLIVFDVLGRADAALLTLGFGILTTIATAVAGYADYADTDGAPRDRATLHSTLMVVALVLYAVSLATRIGASAVPPVGFGLSIAGYVALIAGAYVGGDVVYGLGNMVNRHAWRPAGKKWAPLRVEGELTDGTPTKATMGAQTLVLVKEGERVYALHAVCAHAGGPLHEGPVVEGCIECPWHQSRYRLRDGRHVQGPTTFDQPVYEVRVTGADVWEARRVR
ncbi:MAG: Rieske 2Fe-2S domain-containing protein [Chloroflexota bacterium]|nr:Rieske 2Fe-2S domain-containing protein [Chloroflexota bacterium]